MRSRAQTVRLGIFIATAGGLLLVLLVVLSGSALLARRDHYTILFTETVSGLEVGAAVKLLGVRVGRIESYRVRSDGVDKVEVSVSLDHGTPLRANAEARLSGSGLTGLLFVEITGGTSDAPLIKPGGEIPAGSSLLGTLTGKAENIAIKTEEVINRILTLTDERNLTNLRATLENVQVATRRLRKVMKGLEGATPVLVKAGERLDPLLTELSDAATAVRAAATALDADGALKGTIQQLQRTAATAQDLLGGDHAPQMAADIREAVRSFTDTMNGLSEAIGSSESDVRDVSSSLRAAAEHLEEFARAIRENPSLLIRSTREE
jgi:phospholipid/cholesterol/gamma-HCH transport system substrate-binding protein